MPTPNASNKASTNNAPEQRGADFAQKLARRRSQDFAAKIQGWNQGGAGVVQQQDEVVVLEEAEKKPEEREARAAEGEGENQATYQQDSEAVAEPDSQAQDTKPIALDSAHSRGSPKIPTSGKPSKAVDLERKAWVRRKSKAHADVAPEIKHAGTPKKRVVSDGHWRRDRQTKSETATPEKEATPKPVTIKRSVVSVGLKVPPSAQDYNELGEPVRVRPLRKSRSRSQSREREVTPDYEDSGVKVYIKRRRRSRTLNNERKDSETSQSSLNANSSIGKASSSTDLTTPTLSDAKVTTPRPATAPKERAPRRSLEALEDLRPVSKHTGRGSGHSKNETPHAASKGHAKPVAGDAEPPLRVYSGRIEGWLATAHDPFVDNQEVATEPIKLTVSRARSPLSKREASTSPKLKRTGARRSSQSPIKSRAVKDRVEPERGPDQSSSPVTLHQLAKTRRCSNTSEHLIIAPEGSTLSRASDGDDPRHGACDVRRRLTKHSDLISVLSLTHEERAARPSRRSTRAKRPETASSEVGDIMNELTADELKYQRELRTLVDGVIPVLLTHVLQKNDATGTKRLFSGSSTDGHAVTQPIIEMGVALEKLKAAHKRIPLHDAEELLGWAQSTAAKYVEYLAAWKMGFQDIVVNLAPAQENGKEQHEDQHPGDREKADVQYLLKRPLVRLKHLTQTLKRINRVKPSDAAEEMADRYYRLVQEARQRANDERARLEDESAAGIDPTRARDPRTLAPLAGVSIDPTRSVRARDYFDLEIIHSSGQQLVCKTEIIIRDDAPERGSSSDVLICEVSLAGRWLLFPPVPVSYLSARRGDKDGELVLMIRGALGISREWRELVSLRSDDDGAVSEWLNMIPSTPAPPRLTRQSSFNTLHNPYLMSGGLGDAESIGMPIGEQADEKAERWDGSEVNSVVGDLPSSPGLRRAKAKRYRSSPSSPIQEEPYERAHLRAQQIGDHERYAEQRPAPLRSRYRGRPQSAQLPTTSRWTESPPLTPKKDYSVWLPSEDGGSSSSEASDDEESRQRPGMHRRTSSVPSMDMPTIRKLRKPQQHSSQTLTTPSAPLAQSSGNESASAPAKLPRKHTESSRTENTAHNASQPARANPPGLRTNIPPSFAPVFLTRSRRSSSPLKYEYEPSTASESLSESDLSDVDEVESVTSESGGEEEAVSTVGDLKDFHNRINVRRPLPPRSTFSGASDSIRPSESASQGPYRSVPPLVAQPAKTTACIFSWSDRGAWDSLHPQECSIFVTPGLIEAFDMAQAGAVTLQIQDGVKTTPSHHGVRPLVALELTPLVPLRRGTALDISIRSPPTSNSVIRASNNVMFRSRSPEECEKLYTLINRARIDNPTYIALQNARGPVPTSNWAEVMDQRNSQRTKSGSWLRLGSRKSSTYRSSGSRAASAAATESSVGTMHTAFSALRRFSTGSGIFNIPKSSLTSREGTRSTYSDSLDSGTATPMPIDPSMGTPLGITNAKIRLYIRESASKWRDMGAARLTVMLPPRHDPIVAANPHATGLEKRILILGKSKGEVLLDATLGESCFERVARTGIAVSVWEEYTGPNGEAVVGDRGGVSNSRSRVYMVQMKSERDAAYTFGLVGKLRY